MAKAANNVLSDADIVSELAALGCPFTPALLQQFVTALSVHTPQGTQPRGPEFGADGKLVTPTDASGKILHEELPYDEAEVAKKRKLRSAIERKLNLAYGANAYVPYDGAPPAAAPAQSAPAAPAQAAPAPSATSTAGSGQAPSTAGSGQAPSTAGSGQASSGQATAPLVAPAPAAAK